MPNPNEQLETLTLNHKPMREIRFRAWDGKEMRPIAGISWRNIFGGGEPERYANDSIQDVDYGDSDKPNWQAPWENIPFSGYGSLDWDKVEQENDAKEEEYRKEISALPIMQFTGLKDKIGKEIWESDIVRCHKFTQEAGESLGVREGEREFIATIEFTVYGGTRVVLPDGESMFVWEFEEGWHEESLEVIGNIHQTPTLLDNPNTK